MVNVGHPSENDDLERVIGRTMAEAFGTVIRDPIEDTGTLLLGTGGPASPGRLRAALGRIPGELRATAAAQADRIAPRLPGGSVYTDDRAPVEWLIDRTILGYAADH
jgi:hypothetical protein